VVVDAVALRDEVEDNERPDEGEDREEDENEEEGSSKENGAEDAEYRDNLSVLLLFFLL